ncbi:hypothetical protein F4802DRAFT_593987 [Xylaria palmicola]|nr:hypothetical protein F4802DRAFT_593987 [Xylaria palmicola]
MATEKKPTMLTMTAGLRSHSGSWLNRIFHFHHGGRENNLASTKRLPKGTPRRAIENKKTPARVPASERRPPPSVEPGTVSRPIGTLEMFFKRLGDVSASADREHAAFFTALQVRFPAEVTNPEAYIAKAWEAVGRRFPALRAEISPPDEADPDRRSRFTVRPFDAQSFRESFSVHPDCPNVDALFAPASPIRATATCYWLPRPRQIVLRTAHWRADGFGQVLLTDVFLSTLGSILARGLDAPLDVSLAPQPEDAALTPGLEDLIRAHVREEPAAAGDADVLMDTLVKGGKSIGLPTRPGSDGAAATTCARAAVRLSAESSARLAAACRAGGVSVTSALNAAIIRATARYPQDAGADAYVIFAPVDLRAPLIAAGAQACAAPTGTYVSGLPLRIEGVVAHDVAGGRSAPAKSFGALAAELSAFYSQDLLRYRRPGDDGAGAEPVSLLRLAEPYLERMTELFAGFPAPGCPYPKTPVISSLGKMDGLVKREYGAAAAGLRVDDFWVGIENATPMITFHPWSWADELTLSAAWNESFYSREIAVGALDKIMEELGEGLGMEKVSYRIVSSCYDESIQT